MLLFCALAAHATDDMLIYSDRFHNGWSDNWSWMPRYPTNNPVYSGSNSMACVPLVAGNVVAQVELAQSVFFDIAENADRIADPGDRE